MSIVSKAGLAVRMLGIAISVCVAGELAWAGVERDAATGQASWQSKNATKQAYRTQPGVLTCRTTMTIFNEFYPQRTTVVNIPAPEDRGPGFDLGTLDAAVDSDDCTLDTSQQVMWMAMHPLLPAQVTYGQNSMPRNTDTGRNIHTRRATDTARGYEAGAHRRTERS